MLKSLITIVDLFLLLVLSAFASCILKLLGTQPLELAYLLKKLITSLLESNTLYPS